MPTISPDSRGDTPRRPPASNSRGDTPRRPPASKQSVRAGAIGFGAAALLAGAFAIGAVTLGGSSGSGGAPSATTAKTATLAAASQGGRITVTGTGTITGTPDRLTLSMGVQVNGASVSSALDQANQAVQRVTSALRRRGVAAADIQTAGMSVYPSYTQGSAWPTGYQVSESLTATLTKLSQAGGQIQAAVQAGGNDVTVGGVSLDLSDSGPLLASARASAMADAKAQATQLAAAMGKPLGPVVSITPASTGSTVAPVPQMAASGAAKSVPISAGSQQVTVTITVVYAV